MKAIKEILQKSNPDAVADFEKGAAAFAKKIVANFKDYEFVGLWKPYNLSILTNLCSIPARP